MLARVAVVAGDPSGAGEGEGRGAGASPTRHPVAGAAPGAGAAPAEPHAGRRPLVYLEGVDPARVFGVWPVTVLAAVALVVAVVATAADGALRHGRAWWLPGGAWVAVGIGCYGWWHVRRHRARVLADEAVRTEAVSPPPS